ncbi:MAG: ergothioneine biosynthesis protein EgtB [Planctomycetota bacterium]
MSSMLSDTTVDLLERFRSVRQFSHQICEPLETEDFVVQSMPDVSPTRWHLAHTTWFFETFLLADGNPDYQPVNAAFNYLFNSYYNTVGKQFPRPQRGLLTRPTVAEVFAYRTEVDARVNEAYANFSPDQREILELGLHHEQQHQELMLTDIKHVLSCNPIYPAYHTAPPSTDATSVAPPAYLEQPGGVVWMGDDGNGFCYDNERPRHETLLHPFTIANRLVTNAEYLRFMEDGGYARPDLWLAMGWAHVEEHAWRAPLYWVQRDGEWHEFTLSGLSPIAMDDPVCHVSYFEADAFARWSGRRLPTEAEWESVATEVPLQGNFADHGHFHPRQATADGAKIDQLYGDGWEWTQSPYTAFPGYRPPAGAIGEYNGKFMCNQYVLRGGSCGTSQTHMRPTYRNFFPPEARWQFSAIRLASDA